MRMLFAHGADLECVRCPDDDMSATRWTYCLREPLRKLSEDDVVVGHSFGASIVTLLLAEGSHRVGRAVLLAPPNWGPDGWDVPDYVASHPPSGTAIWLHHCADDAVVPAAHLAAVAARLPGARTILHNAGGHQFAGLEEDLLGETRTQ